MSYFKTFKINDHIFQFKDPMGVLTTLIIGKNKAMLIDTAYGIGDLKKQIEEITKLPLIVIDSHGHMDHTGGNYQFNEVYISSLDIKLCKKHNSLDWRKNNVETAKNLNILPDDFNENIYITHNEGNLVPLETNTIFDLGEIHIKIIPMEGHTKGSIGCLDIEDKILVVTDATCPFVWLFLEESTTVDIYIKMLERTLKLDFDYILLGHGAGTLLPKNRVIEFLNTAKELDLSKSVKVTFNHFENLNSYCYTKYKLYDQSGSGIVFDPKKIE